jgi:hypothetical protein
VKSRLSLKFAIGFIVIIYSALMLVSIPLWKNRWSYVDFPCDWFGPSPSLAAVNASSRIAYCISVYPRSAYGGTPLAYGSTDKDEVTIKINPALRLQRQGTSLVVNGQLLEVGQSFKQRYTSISFNPWLIAVTDLTITNEGLLMTANSGSQTPAPEAIFVSGDATEEWTLTPLGLLFFVGGSGLMILDEKQHKQKQL